MSQLSPEQLAQVESWATDGASLNQVQERLKTEFGINLTYLDARLLMLDVGVRIKDKPREPEKPAEPEPAPQPEPEPSADDWASADETAEAPLGGGFEMSADQIALPGALISGKVTFSDGVQASWFMDQMGRLGLNGSPQGYQPPPADVPLFQQNLDLMLQRAGF